MEDKSEVYIEQEFSQQHHSKHIVCQQKKLHCLCGILREFDDVEVRSPQRRRRATCVRVASRGATVGPLRAALLAKFVAPVHMRYQTHSTRAEPNLIIIPSFPLHLSIGWERVGFDFRVQNGSWLSDNEIFFF